MKTLAIVIGNNLYYAGSTLDNAENDANSISEVFKRLGYDVRLELNTDNDKISELMNFIEESIDNYDATIFYFAGHGFEVEGENYLAGINCQIKNPNKHHCNQTCFRLSELFSIFKKVENKINIVILDACRVSFDRGAEIGFTSVKTPKGTLLAFSTSPDKGSKDHGYPQNSVFTGSILNYIGRERLSVEELFKKVRKTVFALTNGEQVTWEHTSLIGDFYFNEGQLVHSINIPYNDMVVKDKYFEENSNFGNSIGKIRIHNWDSQNEGINEVLNLKSIDLNKNQKFIFGRNLLQSYCGGSFTSIKFFENLELNLDKYQDLDGENHLLNGILYEMYFNSRGEFRYNKSKVCKFEELLALRKKDKYSLSFSFITQLLKSQNYDLIYIPEKDDIYLDINVKAENYKEDFFGKEIEKQKILNISLNDIDISKHFNNLIIYEKSENGIISILSEFFACPKKLVKLHCSIPLKNATLINFEEKEWE